MRVLAFALLLPVVWFGFWIPVISEIRRTRNRHGALAIVLAALGPIGAALAIVSPAAPSAGRY